MYVYRLFQSFFIACVPQLDNIREDTYSQYSLKILQKIFVEALFL